MSSRWACQNAQHPVTLKVESHNGRQVDGGIMVLRDRPKGPGQDQGDHLDLDLLLNRQSHWHQNKKREQFGFRETVLVSHIEYKKGIVLKEGKSFLYPSRQNEMTSDLLWEIPFKYV